MTPKERAWSIAEDIRALAREETLSDVPIINRIAAVIREAIAAEREACAQLAVSKRVSLRGTDTFVSNRALIADEIAAAIRARTNA